MPLYFSSPPLNTDPYVQENNLPDPMYVTLQRQFQAVTEVDKPVYASARNTVIEPDVPYNYGWTWGQQLAQWSPYASPHSAPEIQQSTAAFTKSIQDAARPHPTLSATGVYGPLRAPGINEGYS